MAKGKNRKSRLNIVTTLCNQLITTACGIVIPRVLISAFGSEAYGISVSITQFLSYITLLESGIGGVARAKLYGPLAKNDMAEISAVYRAIRSFFRCVAGAFLVYSIVLGITYHDLANVTLFSKTYIFFLSARDWVVDSRKIYGRVSIFDADCRRSKAIHQQCDINDDNSRKYACYCAFGLVEG